MKVPFVQQNKRGEILVVELHKICNYFVSFHLDKSSLKKKQQLLIK